jgi:hypothetical protein
VGLHRAEFGESLAQRHARPQARDAGVIEIAHGLHLVRPHRKRLPQLGPFGGDVQGVEMAQLWKVEIGREHSNDLVGPPFEHDLATHDVRIGRESAPPEFIAEHDDAIVSRLILFLEERPPQPGARSEHGEQARGSAGRGEALRLSHASQAQRHRPDHGHSFERTHALAPFREVHGVHRNPGREATELGNHLVNGDQSAFVAVAERPDQDSIHDAEDGRVGAHAKGQGGDGDGAESGIAPHGAQGLTKVAGEVHEGSPKCQYAREGRGDAKATRCSSTARKPHKYPALAAYEQSTASPA